MYYMFFNLSNLTSIDLSNFDTSKVTTMASMFYNCSNLTTIKGTIDMKSCISYYNMFDGCTKLKDVNIINPPEDLSDAKLSPSQYIIAP